MNGFYVSLVFFGLLLVLFSLICIFLDKKNIFNFFKSYQVKKQELIDIINDAEEMIEELNRFSDYIVNQMDVKNEELSKNLKLAEDKVNVLSEKARLICNVSGMLSSQKEIEHGETLPEEAVLPVANEMVYSVEVSQMEIFNKEISYKESYNIAVPAAVAVNGSSIEATNPAIASYSNFDIDYIAAPSKKREKVIPFNNKYSEVIKLSQEGLQQLEIAKRLHMGKGEVELILGLRH